jgi:hypothetical protein
MLVVLGVGVPQLATAKEPEPKPKPAKIKPAKLQISGFGLLGNHNLRKQVRTLQSDALKAEQFDANFIEDTALVLLARLTASSVPRSTCEWCWRTARSFACAGRKRLPRR